MTDRYDKEKLKAFINMTWENAKPGSEEWEAAELLAELLSGEYVLKELGLARSRGQHGSTFDVNRIEVKHPAFVAVMDYIDGKLSYPEATNKVAEVMPCGDRVAQSIISELKGKNKNNKEKGRAWKTLDTLKHLTSITTAKK